MSVNITKKAMNELAGLVMKFGVDVMADAANHASRHIANKTQPWGFKQPVGRAIKRDVSRTISTTKTAYYIAKSINPKKANAMAHLLANGNNWSRKKTDRTRKNKPGRNIPPIRRAHLIAREMGLTIVPGGLPEENYYNQRVNGRVPAGAKRVFTEDKVSLGMLAYHRKKKAGFIKSGWAGPWRRKAAWWLNKLGRNGTLRVYDDKVVLTNEVRYASEFTPRAVMEAGYIKGINYAAQKWAAADLERNTVTRDA